MRDYPIGVTVQLKEGIFCTPGCASIVKGHRARREAVEGIIDRLLDLEVQLDVAIEYWQSPTNRATKVPDELLHVVLPSRGADVDLVPVALDQFHSSRGEFLEWFSALYSVGGGERGGCRFGGAAHFPVPAPGAGDGSPPLRSSAAGAGEVACDGRAVLLVD